MVVARERTRNVSEVEGARARGRLDVGAVAGEYVVTEVLADGGGGTVYGAIHRATGRAAAVKVLHPSLIAVPKMVERFGIEVQVLNLLRHPSIVEVWEVGVLPDGRPFFAMERLAGRTVSALLEAEGRLLPKEALEIFEPVCDAIGAAHSAGVIHRDIKPTNIMVLDGGAPRVKLLDFGVAKLVGPTLSASGLTSEGQAIGTPTCMAPEQILGRSVDQRVDIYALGVLLYRMLTGRPPFLAASSLAQMRQHLEERPPRPSARAPAAAPLDAIVLRCLEKDPALRFGSVGELVSAVRAATRRASRPPEIESAADVVEAGAAIHVEVRVAGDEMDARIAGAAGGMLDAVEDALREAGVRIGLMTSQQVLGVGLLPMDPAAAASEVERFFFVAIAVREHLDTLERAEPAVRANVCLHVGEVALRPSSPVEITGGPLTHAHLWVPAEDVRGLCLTATAGRWLKAMDPAPSSVRVVVLPPADPEATPLRAPQ